MFIVNYRPVFSREGEAYGGGWISLGNTPEVSCSRLCGGVSTGDLTSLGYLIGTTQLVVL